MLEIKEPLKSTVLSRVEKRMAEKFEKDTNRENDGDAKRGFSTDQCIQIEAINLQKKILLNRQCESMLVAFSFQGGYFQTDQGSRKQSYTNDKG